MSWKKLWKLGKIVNSFSRSEGALILKLANEERFKSLVLGAYPIYSGENDNEANIRRKTAISWINSPGRKEASIYKLAEIIGKNRKLAGEDVSDLVEFHYNFWADELAEDQKKEFLGLLEFFIGGDKKVKEKKEEKREEKREEKKEDYGDRKNDRDHSNGDHYSEDSKMKDVKKFLNSLLKKYSNINENIEIAIKSLKEKNSLIIPRTNGTKSPGWVSNYDKFSKECELSFYENGKLYLKSLILDKKNSAGQYLKNINENDTSSYKDLSRIKISELNYLYYAPMIKKVTFANSKGKIVNGVIGNYGEGKRGFFIEVITDDHSKVILEKEDLLIFIDNNLSFIDSMNNF
jgi:hypothetical protein